MSENNLSQRQGEITTYLNEKKKVKGFIIMDKDDQLFFSTPEEHSELMVFISKLRAWLGAVQRMEEDRITETFSDAEFIRLFGKHKDRGEYIG